MPNQESLDGQYPNVLRAVLAMPWAIDHESIAWAAIVDVLALRSIGRGLTDDEISARIGGAQNGPRQGGAQTVGILRIPIYGVISPRQNLMARSSGGTTAEAIAEQFRAGMASPDVHGIVLDIDSPGGAVEGVEELASEIRAARGTKPIVAVANHTAASAAYWIASAAEEIVATPSALVGSIGVFAAHNDISEAQAKLGVKTTVISAGKHKAEGALGQPLSEEAVAYTQGQIDTVYGTMVSEIAKGRTYGTRSIGVDAVRSEAYGEGRSLLAKAALTAGMVDRIDTLDATELRMARSIAANQRPAVLRAELDTLPAAPDPEPFQSRLASVSMQARALVDHARERADMRAKEGRSLTASDRAGLLAVADSLREVAAIADEPEPSASTDWRQRARVRLALAQAEHDFELTGATSG